MSFPSEDLGRWHCKHLHPCRALNTETLGVGRGLPLGLGNHPALAQHRAKDALRGSGVPGNQCHLGASSPGMLQNPPAGTTVALAPNQPRISKRHEIADDVNHFPKSSGRDKALNREVMWFWAHHPPHQINSQSFEQERAGAIPNAAAPQLAPLEAQALPGNAAAPGQGHVGQRLALGLNQWGWDEASA